MIWQTLFFTMLFLPTAYIQIKIPLIALTILLIGKNIQAQHKILLNSQILKWVLIQVYAGLFFIVLGVINKTPGAIRVSSVIIFWPILYTVFIVGISKTEYLISLFRIIVISGAGIGLYSLDYILYSYGAIPKFLYFELDMGQSIGFYDGLVEYNLYNISSLIYIVPFLVTIIILPPLDGLKTKIFPQSWIISVLIIDMFCVFLSGRRGLLLVVVLCIPIVLLLDRFRTRNDINTNESSATTYITVILVILYVILSILPNFVEFNATSITTLFESIFEFDSDMSNIERKDQFESLMTGWSYNPLFGHGHGASAEKYGSLRSGDQPWAYELSYVALLYQTGIFGTMFFFGGIFYIYYVGVNIIKNDKFYGYLMLPTLVSLTCFLIANATNPYLNKYDYLWVIYLPLAIINLYLNNQEKLKQQRNV